MKLNENTKVTLTIGQLKKLVSESSPDDIEVTDDPKAEFEEVAEDLFKQGYMLVGSEWSTDTTRIWHICYIGEPTDRNHRETIQKILDVSGLSDCGFVLGKREHTSGFPRMITVDCSWSCTISFPKEYAFNLRTFKNKTLKFDKVERFDYNSRIMRPERKIRIYPRYDD